jgi:hypothetical protein
MAEYEASRKEVISRIPTVTTIGSQVWNDFSLSTVVSPRPPSERARSPRSSSTGTHSSAASIASAVSRWALTTGPQETSVCAFHGPVRLRRCARTGAPSSLMTSPPST